MEHVRFLQEADERDGHVSLLEHVFRTVSEHSKISTSVSCTERKEKAKDKKSKLLKTETVMEYSDKSRRIEAASKGKAIHCCFINSIPMNENNNAIHLHEQYLLMSVGFRFLLCY